MKPVADSRPEYEPPRLLRLATREDASASCSPLGSGDGSCSMLGASALTICYNDGSSAVTTCEYNGGSAAQCASSGSSANP
jgi:hypothetical protein